MMGSDAVWTAALVVWTGAAAWMDWRQRRVWWAWFIMGGMAAGVYRLLQWVSHGFAFDQLLLIAAIVAAAFQLWRAKIWGGADAKMIMVLILASPDWRMVLVLALVDLIVIVGWVLVQRRIGGLPNFGNRIQTVLRGERLDGGETVPLVAVMAIGTWIYLLFLS
jgi:Flp pilus assembly protein protease CpaA